MIVQTLNSWDAFHAEVLRQPNTTIWRGQRCDWLLKSRFDSELGPWSGTRVREQDLRKILDDFRREMRRSHPQFSLGREDDSVWAIGRHYGLLTPLLDWTRSPYIAAYFAFANTAGEDDGFRYLYALRITSLQRHLDRTKTRYVTPVSVGFPSPRYSAQRSVLTKALNGLDIEAAVNQWTDYRTRHSKDITEPVLVKYRIPVKGAADCNRVLRALDRMNVNYETLLLDIQDIVKKCNDALATRVNAASGLARGSSRSRGVATYIAT